MPVVDAEGRMNGIVTVDDVVDVAEEEATEDIQKSAAWRRWTRPTCETGFLAMIRKRAGWLAVAVPRRDADRHRDGLLRGGDRQRGGAGPLRAADHQQRRQLRLAGHHADHPRDGARRGAACATGGASSGASSPTGLVLGAILGAIGLVRILAWQALSRRPTARTTCSIAVDRRAAA